MRSIALFALLFGAAPASLVPLGDSALDARVRAALGTLGPVEPTEITKTHIERADPLCLYLHRVRQHSADLARLL